MKHGDVVYGMLAVEDAFWHPSFFYHQQGDIENQGYRSNHPCINLQGSHLLLHHPNDVFGDEIGHERIAWQQINAALALWDAVEEEYQEESEPGEHLQRSSLLRILKETGLRELLPWQNEEREQ